jgi:SAM-dependent methyltransferase
MFYENIDFIDLYRRKKQEFKSREKTETDWDQMAEEFHSRHHELTPYVARFLHLMDLSGVNSILDFGCGSGTLTVPLSGMVEQVVAADFSGNMLFYLEQDIERMGLENVQIYKKSWSDNWDDLPPVDMVIASRCISSTDFSEVVQKMTEKARLRVGITWLKSPGYVNPLILNAIGRPIISGIDWIYPVNILYQLGYDPQVNFISWESDGDDLPEEADFVETLRWKIGELMESEVAAARKYYNDYVVNDPLKYGHIGFSWAYISWDKQKRNW